MLIQKAQSLFVEPGHVFIDGGVRAAFEDKKLAPSYSVLKSIGETQRRNSVVAAESNSIE
jgi:hypothetical protein